jgi:predicted amidohydrolase
VSDFRVAAAQIATIRGEIVRNVRTHVEAMTVAAGRGVSVLVFPELSLTGYEPQDAAGHALAVDDVRLDPIGELARRCGMCVVAGLPLLTGSPKPMLGAILFGPDGSRRTYAKMHLGGSEENFYSPGCEPLSFETHGQTVGLSICADAAQPSHPKSHADRGATVYAAGVFLNAEWYATDAPRLAAYAPRHRMLVVMANHAASVGTHVSVGRSAIWAPDGTLLAQATGVEDALIIATRGPLSWQAEVCPM